ncbi:MAG TPA: alpha/beta hydrolase [Chitinophagaceae bacterium]|nr:alpha/beta hydrolase [Chitinophagaceae bacterium]
MDEKILQILKLGVLIIVSIVLLWVLVAPGCMTFRISDDKAQSIFARKGLELKTNTIKVNGKDIHYAMVGNDTLPTLVFLHGSPSAWNAFLSYMQDPELLFHFRMVSIDRPGFGFSDFGYALPLDEQSKLLMPVFREIRNNKPIYLAGHSLGGPLVVKMAADAPDLFAGIMLISGSVDPGLEPREQWRFFMENAPFKYFLPGSFRPSNTELVYFKKDVIALVPDFLKVKCAVYLVHGDKDTWVPPANVEFAKQKLVNASKVKVLMLPGGTHFIPWTKKKEITDEMVSMLH